MYPPHSTDRHGHRSAEQNREQTKKRRAEKAAKGFCYECDEPAVPVISLCQKHRLLKSLQGHPARDSKNEAKDLQKLREMQ
jgi:hypothetical protein